MRAKKFTITFFSWSYFHKGHEVKVLIREMMDEKGKKAHPIMLSCMSHVTFHAFVPRGLMTHVITLFSSACYYYDYYLLGFPLAP